MNVFVSGGLGFIGSHTCVELIAAGHTPIVADDLSNAAPDVLDRIEKITGTRPIFYRINIADRAALERVFSAHRIDAVIHFAGFKAVGESCRIPLAYYRNNLDTTLTLLEVMRAHDCRRFVFSSSATVYGPENPVPYREEQPTYFATNPYGWTKVMIEQILRDVCAAEADFSAVLLRYFNPIGAHPSGLLGDDPQGIPNNLMPYIARVAAGRLSRLTVFGNDYDTADGTCVRDYIHVVDLARGHLAALNYTAAGAEVFNLGTGRGTSVLEMVHTFSRVNGVEVPYVIGPRRVGDLPRCWADASKAERLLGWRAEKSTDEMCRDSWNYIKKCSRA